VNPLDEVTVTRPAAGVGVLTLNRPDRLNALTLDMIYRAIPAALSELESDPAVGAIILTGAGRGFCAGADLESGAFEIGSAELKEHVVRSHRGPWQIFNSSKPTIAAVNGPAAGAGLGLALACDIRIGSPTSVYVTSFMSMAMVPDFGLTWSLQEAVGAQRAALLLLSGGRLDAQQAVYHRLIAHISDDALGSAVALASQIAQTPVAAARMKTVMRAAGFGGMEATLFEIEPEAQAEAMASSEFTTLFAEYKARIRRG
jgi:enoyl-CoA hydratase/carnithine racemase